MMRIMDLFNSSIVWLTEGRSPAGGWRYLCFAQIVTTDCLVQRLVSKVP